jgi:hypothetical protein
VMCENWAHGATRRRGSRTSARRRSAHGTVPGLFPSRWSLAR